MRSVLPALVTVFLLCHPGTAHAQQSWVSVEATNLSAPRHENAFAKVGKKFYLLGGRGIKPVGIFDTDTHTWSEGAPAPVEFSHVQAVSHQGLIYIMGALVGSWPSETPLSHILVYNPLTDSWLLGPEIPVHRRRGAAGAVVYKDKIYLVCGIVNGHTSGWVPWLDVFDTSTNGWSELPDAPRSRDHLQAAVAGDKLVVTGGRRSGYKGQGFEATIAETDIYDLNSGTWKSLPSPSGDIPTQRAGCTAIPAGDEIVIIGGESGSQVPAHAEAEALNISTGTWRSLPSLQRGRHGTQALASDGQLFIAAGCGDRGGSPELDSFETLAMPGIPDDAEADVLPGELSPSDTRLEFGAVTPGSMATADLELWHNGGNQAIVIPYVSIVGSPAFKLDFPFGFPYILSPGGRVALGITFAPVTEGAEEASLLIKTMDNGKTQPVEIFLKGN